MKAMKMILVLMLITQTGFGQCELKAKRITIFKDATVFVEKEGRCDVEANILQVDVPYQEQINNPSLSRGFGAKNEYVKNHIILGTLELECPNNKILSYESISIEKEQEFGTMLQLMAENKGKLVSVILKGSNQAIEGKIFSLESTGENYMNKSLSKNLILRNENKWYFVALGEIEEFEFVDKPLLFGKNNSRALLVRLSENRDDQEIKMSYLRKGITWTPNYFINITDDENLELTLKVNVINDVERLENVELNLAVGIPIFKYSTVGDPMFSSQRVIDLITSLNNMGGRKKSPMTNVMTSQVMSKYVESYGNNVEPVVEGRTKDDIFMYNLKDVSIGRGERINFDVLEMKSDFEDLYVVNLVSNDYILSSNSRKQKEKESNMIWHSLKFDNIAGVPLTTGSVFFKDKKDGNDMLIPLSQGQLDFTPAGKHCIVKMNIAPNVIVKDSDREISREKDQTRGFGKTVSVSGEIEINNFKDEKITMLISREVRGAMLNELNRNWEIRATARYLYDFNQLNLVTWSVELEPNEKKIINYEYEVFIR